MRRGSMVEVHLVVPMHSLAFLPASTALSSVGLSVNSVSVLLAIVPVALVLATVLPRVDAESVLAVI